MAASPSRLSRRTCVAGALALSLAIVPAGLALASGGSHASPAAQSKKHPKPHAPKTVTPGDRYLAIGDSVTFGYREPSAVPKPEYKKASNFVGWPEIMASDLGLKLTNAGCPGETSASLVNDRATSNGCENNYDATTKKTVSTGAYRKMYPLHVKYSGSQLAFAESFLKEHPRTALVTLQVGANDGFLCVKETDDGCASEIPSVLKKIQANLKKILVGIRDKAHYTGQIILVSYYPIDKSPSFDDIGEQSIQSAEQSTAKPYHVKYADAYTAFSNAAAQYDGDPCLDGLLNVVTAGTGTDGGNCGVHPSESGYSLIASTVAKVIKK